ncbi:MAG: hypothetical protein E7348_06445 [Clostridiales bacterium]|nr:hypothetical protein [Clostridiales bacterium]
MKKLFNNDWVRSISVLLILAVFLGGLLAVLSDVLYVAPEERAERAIKKIYGSTMKYEIELDIDIDADSQPIEYKEIGKINKIYTIQTNGENGYDMLFQSVGFNGYKGGTITVWVKVSVNETTSTYAIDKVLLESYEKQTLMSKLGGDYYNNFCLTDVTTAYKNKEFFTTSKDQVNSNPVSGATYSATAGINAVNCVIEYIGLTYEKGVQNG